ncbi:MAG: Type 1 glutamine amidotransferase-like domain-containing protein, partial [Gammaproteobacteria bacterium]|nr:Type 1 glutamine amidotransferase-like domain-containing protein [Gammaproteobacteria bacterium]
SMKKVVYLIIASLLNVSVLAENTVAPTMKLYLASSFSKVWDDIATHLPLVPTNSLACHIPTAGFNADWTHTESDRIRKSGFTVKRIDIAKYDESNIADEFKNCDIIYVGGGDEFYLLQEFRRSGFDKVVQEKIALGVPYIGSSAGSMVLGSSIEFAKSIRKTEASPLLKSYDGLNIIPLSLFVHFGNPDLKEIYRNILAFALEDGTIFITMNDDQFLFAEGNQWRLVEAKE